MKYQIHNIRLKDICEDYWESVEGSVLQATGTVEFEDGLRTESSLEATVDLSDQISILPSSAHGWY